MSEKGKILTKPRRKLTFLVKYCGINDHIPKRHQTLDATLNTAKEFRKNEILLNKKNNLDVVLQTHFIFEAESYSI